MDDGAHNGAARFTLVITDNLYQQVFEGVVDRTKWKIEGGRFSGTFEGSSLSLVSEIAPIPQAYFDKPQKEGR